MGCCPVWCVGEVCGSGLVWSGLDWVLGVRVWEVDLPGWLHRAVIVAVVGRLALQWQTWLQQLTRDWQVACSLVSVVIMERASPYSCRLLNIGPQRPCDPSRVSCRRGFVVSLSPMVSSLHYQYPSWRLPRLRVPFSLLPLQSPVHKGRLGCLVCPLLGALDQVLPWRVLLGLALAAKLLGSVLKVGDIRLTPLVGGGVVTAPLGGDPPEMAA